jgi:hypothetical protein
MERHHARRRREVQRRETVVTTLGRPAPSEAVREAVTMALYVGVVLAAEFVAVEEHAVDEPSTVAVIWGTALGVALAHVFAFNLAARLFAGGRLDGGTRRAVWAQLASAATVAFVVTVPFLFLALGPALEVSGFLLAALIGVTAYVASREAGAGRIRSLVDGVIALAVAMAIVSVKVGLTGH